MSETKPLVLLTGAAGVVGTALRSALSGYRVRLHDRDLSGCELRANEEPFEGDLADYPTMRRAADGCDAVVHLAGERRVRASWAELRTPNVEGVYNIFEAARQASVRRVVFASSNHVTGMHDRRRDWPIGPGDELAPDSLYGVTKAFGEALGRYYADTSDLSVICLRIGWVTTAPLPENAEWRRMWLSDADLGDLVRRSLVADVRFGIYYGVSANTPLRYDMASARRDLGYEPKDDATRAVSTRRW
jgi:nucleoside-diphosphate-sugar epimerase